MLLLVDALVLHGWFYGDVWWFLVLLLDDALVLYGWFYLDVWWFLDVVLVHGSVYGVLVCVWAVSQGAGWV